MWGSECESEQKDCLCLLRMSLLFEPEDRLRGESGVKMWSYLRWPETQRRPQRENRHDTSITLTRSTHPPQQTLGITSQVCRRGINLPQNTLTKLKIIVLDGSVKFCQVDNMTFCTQVITRASFFLMAGRPRGLKVKLAFPEKCLLLQKKIL